MPVVVAEPHVQDVVPDTAGLSELLDEVRQSTAIVRLHRTVFGGPLAAPRRGDKPLDRLAFATCPRASRLSERLRTHVFKTEVRQVRLSQYRGLLCETIHGAAHVG
jgi:hypothetical protein